MAAFTMIGSRRAAASAVTPGTQGAIMPATGELIRLMNYVDDIAATLRRINASLPTMTEEERARLADYIRKSDPSLESVLQHLDTGAK
jgi:hypothetical protein